MRHSTINGRIPREAIYLNQHRNTPPERSAGVLNEEHSKKVIYIIYIGQSFWVFAKTWPANCFLLSHLIGPRTLTKTHTQLFAKIDPITDLWVHVHTYFGVGPPPFSIPKEPPCTCTDMEVFLDLRSGHFISLLQQKSASASRFVLGISG